MRISRNNTGLEYEQLTKSIFEALLTQDKVDNLKVEHNVVLPGKTTQHQVDVYWEFRAGGIVYRTAVQAKDWTRTVTQSTVFTFAGVINDLLVHPVGVMVCQRGYQKGAKKVAQANGIHLYELRKPRTEDWDGHLRVVSIKFVIPLKNAFLQELVLDAAWMTDQLERRGLTSVAIPLEGLTSDYAVFDANGNSHGTLSDLLNDCSKTVPDAPGTYYASYRLSMSTFVETKAPSLPQVKLRALTAKIVVSQNLEVRWSST